MLQLFKKIIEDNFINVISLKNCRTRKQTIHISLVRDGEKHNINLVDQIFDLKNKNHIEISYQSLQIFIKEINKLNHETIFEIFQYAQKNKQFNIGFQDIFKNPEIFLLIFLLKKPSPEFCQSKS